MNNPAAHSEIINKLEVFTKKRIEIVVHLMRVFLKIGLIFFLFINKIENFWILTIYIAVSEVLDQLSLLLIKKKPEYKSLVGIFYILNSVLVITIIGYFAGWITNDYYLLYLIHISSATVAYGAKFGLLSFVISMMLYSGLLFGAQADFGLYLRLPFVSILALRILISQTNYERAEKVLSEAMNIEKMKKDFIAIASHNLRTPVAAIYGYLDLLVRGAGGKLVDKQLEYVQRIRTNNEEMENLSESLLQISILETGKEMNLMKQPSQIEVIIEAIVNNLAPVAQAKGVVLVFHKNNSLLPIVNIDVEKIRSVILNLVDNAIKYTEKGSIVIEVRSDEANVYVSVKDTGMGIAKDDLPKVFEKFFRAGDILIYNQRGTGLGLFIGKEIIEQHGGEIKVDSTLGAGTTFTFSVPILKENVLE